MAEVCESFFVELQLCEDLDGEAGRQIIWIRLLLAHDLVSVLVLSHFAGELRVDDLGPVVAVLVVLEAELGVE